MARARTKRARGNRLLAALPPAERGRLAPHLEPIELELKQSLIEPDRPIEHVYFIDSGVASLLAVLDDDRYVEIATVGAEGMIGVPVFLGASSTSNLSFMQIPGRGHRLPAERFRQEVANGGQLRSVVQRYTQMLFDFIGQNAACNRGHVVEQRCARWLLMTHDRVDHAKQFPLTHEFLAQMLGVRRATVTETAQALQDVGAIDYSRGIVTVCDRVKLEAASCSCYEMVSQKFEELWGG